jgi:hypothetical protein
MMLAFHSQTDYCLPTQKAHRAIIFSRFRGLERWQIDVHTASLEQTGP